MQDYDEGYPWIKESLNDLYKEIINLYELKLEMEKNRKKRSKSPEEEKLREVFGFPKHMTRFSLVSTTFYDEESGLSMKFLTNLN